MHWVQIIKTIGCGLRNFKTNSKIAIKGYYEWTLEIEYLMAQLHSRASRETSREARISVFFLYWKLIVSLMGILWVVSPLEWLCNWAMKGIMIVSRYIQRVLAGERGRGRHARHAQDARVAHAVARRHLRLRRQRQHAHLAHVAVAIAHLEFIGNFFIWVYKGKT